MKPELTIEALQSEASRFAQAELRHKEPTIFGVTDGKAVGTYFEHKFRAFLTRGYSFDEGSSAKGIDFPSLGVDMKVTSVRQPQSSCPFRSARQKVYGLGYSLLVFVYDKHDDPTGKTGTLEVLHTIFVDERRTADFQTTSGIADLLDSEANVDDLSAFLRDRNLPVDDIQANDLAEEILRARPLIGYLTISNALQWRLQYRRIIEKADEIDGITRL